MLSLFALLGVSLLKCDLLLISMYAVEMDFAFSCMLDFSLLKCDGWMDGWVNLGTLLMLIVYFCSSIGFAGSLMNAYVSCETDNFDILFSFSLPPPTKKKVFQDRELDLREKKLG